MTQGEWVSEMFQQHGDALFRYLRSFRLSQEDAYDLVQSVFLKLMDVKPGSLDHPRAWLFRVGRNLTFNEMKRRRPDLSEESVEQMPVSGLDPLGKLLEEDEFRRLWQAFGTLSETEQELLQLQVGRELSIDEIALIVGRSPGATKVAIHRSRQRLRERMEETETSGMDRAAARGGAR